MSDNIERPATPPAGPAEDAGENSTIRAIRAAQADAERRAREAEATARDYEAKLKEIERAKLEENERLKLELADRERELADAARLRDEHGRFVSEFESLYQSELASVPEEKRAHVEALSAQGAWPDRVKALRAARELIGQPAPLRAGDVTRPVPVHAPVHAPEPQRIDPKNPATYDWDTAFQTIKRKTVVTEPVGPAPGGQ